MPFRIDLAAARRPLHGILVLLLAWIVCQPYVARAAAEFLDPEAAFVLGARAVDARTVEIRVAAAPGYYLYRDRFGFSAAGATLGEPVYPPGKVKFDETFQKNVEIYHGEVRILIPVSAAPAGFTLLATSQGCADRGLCYPPAQRAVDVRLTGFGGDGSVKVFSAAQTEARESGMDRSEPAASRPAAVGAAASDGRLDATLRAGRFWSVVGVFFVAGLLLSLTPCVLPMLPILSSIIVGQRVRASRRRGLGLAASYSLGMALVYTALGVAAGLAGEGLAASLQNPWTLGLFAAALVALSLSMFGAYEIQLPTSLTSRLAHASGRLPAGRIAGVFAMGGVSALIVSPCVAAPLAGALVYLSQTRDVWLGGTALFSLAGGMSVPLLLVGASAGTLLPRAGAWMTEIKRLFGALLLGVALWTVQSILPGALVLGLWGALAIGVAGMLAWPGGSRGATGTAWRRGLAAAFAVVGVLQFAGAAAGGDDPLRPLARFSVDSSARGGREATDPQALPFIAVRNVAELDAAMSGAQGTVMLDFYADWCVSCKEMERFTFSEPEVRRKLAGALLLKADVTGNSSQDRELLRRFGLFGPPGTLFFEPRGQELAQARVIGFQGRDQFIRSLAAAGL